MTRKMLVVLFLVVTSSACGEIKNFARLEQPINQVLIAGVGDTIIQIETEESLPNIAGKADLFGRTRPTGRVFLTYLGLEQGRVAFERQNIEIQSNATTMNSTPLIIPQSSTTTYSGSANVYGNVPSGPISGTAMMTGTSTTSAPPLVLPPSGSTTMAVGGNQVRYFIAPNDAGEIIVGGYQVIIVKATPTSLRYKVQKVKQ